jgi:hypothetical protein
MDEELPEDERREEANEEARERDEATESMPPSVGDEPRPRTSEAPESTAAVEPVAEELPAAEQSSPPPASGQTAAGQVTRIAIPSEQFARPLPSRPGSREVELPLARDRQAASDDPVDQLFPPELRQPARSQQGDAEREAASEAHASSPARENLGQPLPRVQVLVTLHDAQVWFDEAIDEAWQRLAPKFQQLAEREVRYADWARKCDERAADWRLRGP